MDNPILIIYKLSSMFLSFALTRPLSRFCENEADTYAVKVMKNAHLDALRGSSFFERIDSTSKMMELFSTHPSDESRL